MEAPGSTRMRSCAGSAAAAGMAVLMLSSCASWTPPVFSPSLSSDERCAVFIGGATPAASAASAASDPLEGAVDDIKTTRKRYIHAARCLTQDTSLGGAALIGLSSLALFKAVTKPHPKDMAGLGILGGATYLYAGGDSAIGQRRLVYYAGADALSCTLQAAEPYRTPKATKGSLTLPELVDKALTARDALLAPERDLMIEAKAPAEVQKVPGRAAAAACDQVGRQVCPEPGPGASAAEVASARACKKQNELCVRGADTERTKTVHPAVRLMLADIAKVRNDIDKLVVDSTALESVIGLMTVRIEKHAALIQTQVAREADKTFPDLNAVLNSAGKLRTVAFNVSKASVFGDPPAAEAPAGKTESTGTSSQFKAPPETKLSEARQKLGEAIRAASDLRRTMMLSKQRIDNASIDLQSCVVSLPASTTTTTETSGESSGATPPSASTNPPPSTPGLVVADADPKVLNDLLGLSQDASGDARQAALKACEQKLFNRSTANGVKLDGDMAAAVLQGRCKGAGS